MVCLFLIVASISSGFGGEAPSVAIIDYTSVRQEGQMG
jgi:hypothetical protein